MIESTPLLRAQRLTGLWLPYKLCQHVNGIHMTLLLFMTLLSFDYVGWQENHSMLRAQRLANQFLATVQIVVKTLMDLHYPVKYS
jgi:uncharacterized membrane protein